MAINELLSKEMKSLHCTLNQGKIEDICELRQTKTFLNILGNYNVEVISFISSFLDDKQIYTCSKVTQCYEELIKIVVEGMDALDSFITFLELIDEDDCCLEKFIFLLKPLKLSLEKLSDLRGCWLEWSLSTISCYMSSLALPEDHQTESGEKKMLIVDTYVDNIIRMVQCLFDFYEPYINNTISSREEESLFLFGLQLLTEPAVFVYVEKFNDLEQTCQKIIKCINQLPRNICYFLDCLNERRITNSLNFTSRMSEVDLDDAETSVFHLEDKISFLNLAVYYYFAVTEEPFSIFPCVYEKLYLFHKIFFLCIILLRHTHNAVVRKGLLLTERLLLALEDGCIPYCFLELKLHPEFVKLISSICVYSYIFENRKLAIKLLQIYVQKFDPRGTYALYLNITTVTNSPDVDSEIITLFRNDMYTSFVKNELQYYQKDKLLIDLLKVFCRLGDNEDVNIMEQKNKILSLLNLLALILRRDTNNETTVKNHFEHFERNYLSVVKVAAEKLRNSFEKDLHNLLYTDKSILDEKFSIIVDGEHLPQLKEQEKVNATRNALNALNMIDHALELVHEYAI